MSTIALFGANGTFGSRILDEALQRGHNVTAIVRDPSKLDDPPPGVQVTTGDILDPHSVAAASAGHDVIISAVGGGDGPGHLATIEPAARSLVEGLRKLGDDAPRLITVGGAGSLRTPTGSQVWDAPGLPEQLLQIMHAHGDALDYLRDIDDIDWTYISPAANTVPGERTGSYRTSSDGTLVIDEQGNSTISVEDYAIAVIDEAEEPKHNRQRLAVAH